MGENSKDQNFNQSELEDIMNEIEELEKEVVSETSSEMDSAQDSDGPLEVSGQAEEIAASIAEVTSKAPEEHQQKEEAKQGLQSSIDAELEQAMQSSESSESPVDVSAEEGQTYEEDSELEEEPAIEFDESELEALECDLEDSPEESNVVQLKKDSSSTSVPGSEVELSARGQMGLHLNFHLGEDLASLDIDQEEGLTIEMSGFTLHLHPESGCRVELEGGIQFTVPISGGTPVMAGQKTKKSA